MSDLRKRPYLACEQGGVFKEWYMEPAELPELRTGVERIGHEYWA